jgi:cell division protein ZapA
MTQVNVTISGKSYRMACEDGQEEHLGRLAERLDRTIDRLRGEFGEIGDQRLTVMAAITMADQNADSERRLSELEAKVAGMEEGRSETIDRQHGHEVAVARSIETLAERIEALADRLADGPGQINGG